MILVVHLHGAVSHDVGDEIWQESLGAAIRAEAESIVFGAEPDLLEAGHNEMRDRIVAEMSGALSEAGDSYRAPDGIWYSLIEAPGIEGDDDTLIAVSSAVPVVEEVLRFEVLPTDGSRGGRGGHGHDGPLEPSRIVVCGRCGHEDGAGSGLIRLTSPDNEYETAKAARVARHHAEARVRKWHSDAMTLAASPSRSTPPKRGQPESPEADQAGQAWRSCVRWSPRPRSSARLSEQWQSPDPEAARLDHDDASILERAAELRQVDFEQLRLVESERLREEIGRIPVPLGYCTEQHKSERSARTARSANNASAASISAPTPRTYPTCTPTSNGCSRLASVSEPPSRNWRSGRGPRRSEPTRRSAPFAP